VQESTREETYDAMIDTLRNDLTIIPEADYVAHEEEALDRVPRDARDWPIAALAIALGCGVWTEDRDFFGCGVPVWTTQTLVTHVEAGRANLTP